MFLSDAPSKDIDSHTRAQARRSKAMRLQANKQSKLLRGSVLVFSVLHLFVLKLDMCLEVGHVPEADG